METEIGEQVDSILKQAERRRVIAASVDTFRNSERKRNWVATILLGGFSGISFWRAFDEGIVATIDGKHVALFGGCLNLAVALLILGTAFAPLWFRRRDKLVHILAEEVIQLKRELEKRP